MARQEIIQSITLLAAADLRTHQFKFVDFPSAAGVTLVASVTDRTIGVLQNTPNINEAATVAVSGVVKVEAGEAVAVGGVVKADATGRATDVAIATSEIELGIALTAAGSAGELIEVLLGHGVKGGIA